MRLACFASFVCVMGCAAAPSPVEPGPDGGGFIPLPDVPDAGSCRGNRDGVIDRAEVFFLPGVEARYRVNPPGTQARVDAHGTMRADGTRAWDFRDGSGVTAPLTLLDARGQWFAVRFPTAQYAARLDPRAGNLGVYRATDTAVELLGVAGAAEAEGTLVRYDVPVGLLRFPLRVGAAWTADATTVDSTVQNTPVASRDHYDVTVDARGEVRLAELTFTDALRVRVEVTQRFPAGPGVRRIQYLWMVECYGEAARMTSLDNEVNPDFTMAAEFRRLGL
ncbi:MAG: hypothetical protein U0324_08280 [Polyangiales bacterium]